MERPRGELYELFLRWEYRDGTMENGDNSFLHRIADMTHPVNARGSVVGKGVKLREQKSAPFLLMEKIYYQVKV
jgi:hypothetical protein